MEDDLSNTNDELVTIVKTYDLMQADFVRAQLESADMDVFIPNEGFQSTRHPWSWVTPIEVQVPASQAQEAETLLREWEARAEAGEFEPLSEEDEYGPADDEPEEEAEAEAEESPYLPLLPTENRKRELLLYLLYLSGIPLAAILLGGMAYMIFRVIEGLLTS